MRSERAASQLLGGLLQKMEGDSSVCNVSDVLLGQQNTAHFPSRGLESLRAFDTPGAHLL